MSSAGTTSHELSVKSLVMLTSMDVHGLSSQTGSVTHSCIVCAGNFPDIKDCMMQSRSHRLEAVGEIKFMMSNRVPILWTVHNVWSTLFSQKSQQV